MNKDVKPCFFEIARNVLCFKEVHEEKFKSGRYFSFIAKDNSLSPIVNVGDLIIFRQQDDAESGKICVVMVNGDDATLKEIKKNINGILPVKIIGVVVEIRICL